MQTNQMTFDNIILPLLPFQMAPAPAAQPAPAPEPKPTRCMCGATVQPDGELPCGH